MTEQAPRALGRAGTTARGRIVELIDAGVYPPGSKLPGERELAAALQVSRSVLRDALAVLADERVLEASPWRGWFVTGPHMAEKVELQSFTQMAQERGLVAGATVLAMDRRRATMEEGRQLRLAPGETVVDLLRLRTLNSRPACVDHSVIPDRIIPDLTQADFTDSSLYGTLEAASRTVIVRSDYTVRADGASAEEAAQLDLAPGAPVLVGEELASGIDGTPVLLGRVVYRSDAYEFQATLFRAVSQ